MDTISLKTPAKINIALDINGKAASGYHLLSMVTQTVDIFDYITVSKNNSKKIKISSKGLKIPTGRKNIVYKAIEQFFLYTKINFTGIDIKIKKNIPIKAGLGGGSSNAAATLIALNELFSANLPLLELQSIGLKIGADVPLFFKGGTCLVEGIGEILTPLPNFPNSFFVVVKPSIGFSTSEVYNNFDKIQCYNKIDISKIIAGIIAVDLKEISSNAHNVLEYAITSKEIPNIKNLLIDHGAITALMTGSGSAVFGIFENKNIAKKSQKILANIYNDVFLCQPINYGVFIDNQL